MDITWLSKDPPDFHPTCVTVSCFCLYNGESLVLLRHEDKSYPGTWCMPGGKSDDGEDLFCAIARELEEETGIVAQPEDFQYFGTRPTKIPGLDLIHHMFFLELEVKPAVRVHEGEHIDACWGMPQELLSLDLIPGQERNIREFFGV